MRLAMIQRFPTNGLAFGECFMAGCAVEPLIQSRLKSAVLADLRDLDSTGRFTLSGG